MKAILIRISLIITVAVSLWTGSGTESVLGSKTSARIGMLPFQIYSGTKVDYLQDVIPKRLAQQLKNNPAFTIIEGESFRSFIPEKQTGWFSRKELDRLAVQTGAQFLVFGSLTKIEENLSIDARVFTTLKESPSYKSFVEGKDLDQLIEELGSRISQHISALAPPAPPSLATPFEAPVEEELLNADAPPTGADLPEGTRLPLAPSAANGEFAATRPAPSQRESGQEVLLSRSGPAPAPGEVREAGAPPGKRLARTQAKPSYRPINITSDRLEADNRNRTVDFLGNVVAKREDMVIFSDRISAFYTEEGQIEKIIARGNVKINQQDRIATCLEAVFFQPTQKIVLTGTPKVWQGKNIVTGGKIIISLNEDKIDIEGAGKNERVNAIIYPMGKDLQ